ncbi:DAK2 domain-containing protein, partial [Streptomyces albus]|uniref:DAK2 domain-containing protein n=1 Tax=Streptomyces albus TaxID=1888 RepID=UPI001FADB38D
TSRRRPSAGSTPSPGTVTTGAACARAWTRRSPPPSGRRPAKPPPAELLGAAGDAWAAEAGGTSGALWGAGLRAFGAALPDDRAPEPAELAAGARAALEAVTALGKAEPGDKTLVDALAPFVTAFTERVEADTGPADAFRAAAETARTAAADTAGLRPRLGRARPLAERSVGTPDPGATSLAMVLAAVAGTRTAPDRRNA